MTDHQGLTSHQVESLRKEHGRNVLPEKHQQSVLSVFLSQFKSPLVFILIIVSIITYFLDEKSDTVVILLVVFVNSIIGTFQEVKALHSLESLKQFLTPQAKVYRDGKPQLISAEELVPQDLVILEAGDRVPADGVLIEAKAISINESQLTGEAYPVAKNTSDSSAVAMGTLLTTGRGVMKVEKIGVSTALGQISQTVVDHIAQSTPLEHQLRKVIDGILVIVAVACVGLFGLGFIEKIPLDELFKTVVSIGVSAIPEGLPIVVTVTLALGVIRMSQKKAILRNLPSVSTLAGVDVICTDKTGTLTEDKIVLQTIWSFIEGKFSDKKQEKIYQMSVLCNDAQTGEEAIGDLLDIALLNAAKEEEIDPENVREKLPRIGEIPFDNEQRWQATLHEVGKTRWMIVKGAPDALLKLSKISEREKTAVEKKVLEFADQGLRVLAIAEKVGKQLELYHPKDVHGLSFQGLLVFSDKLRSDAAAAVKKCQDADIQVIMITGDHLNTAKSIAEEIGIYKPGTIAVTGEELNDSFHFTKTADQLSVVARATPFDKSALIDQLRTENKLVAMTGDGVNDAPALVKADIGIAMGKSGTDAAREAADMVLVDDAFSTIVDGITSARGIFENIRKVISYLFTTSYGELGLILLAMILMTPLPLVAAQILWLNLITDGLLDIAISTEATRPGIMKRTHHRYKGKIIDKLLLLRIILLGTVMAVGTMSVFIIELENHNLEYARTSALIVLAIFQWFHAFNSRSESRSIFELGFTTNRPVLIALAIEVVLLLAAVYLPFLQGLLKTVPVSVNVWIAALALGAVLLIVEEIRKWIFNRFDLRKYFTTL